MKDLKYYWTTNWIPHCCASCIHWDPIEVDYSIQCDKKWIVMPNEYFASCYLVNKNTTRDRVETIIKEYIRKNSWI